MSFFTPENLGAQTGGRWHRRGTDGRPVNGIGIDTREDLQDKAFVAIRGDRHDGHDHLRAAAAAGARLLIAERPPPQGAVSPEIGVLLVDDTRAALGRLAAAYRQTLWHTTVVAVTGSCGKTTVKTMIDAVLAGALRGGAAPRSFNNDIGVPLSILAAEPTANYLVLEVGANAPGEINHLASIAQPDIAVITMVGRAHLEGFGSLDTVVREKAALLRHLRGDRLAVVNADEPMLRGHMRRADSIVLFGEADDADLRLTGWGADNGSWWLEVNHEVRLSLGLPGHHNARNALAALAVGRYLGVDEPLIAEALRACRPLRMRLSRHDIGPVTIYNDAYNANPDSVTASLASFADLAAGAPRRVVIIGDMLELGDSAPEAHREIGRRVVELDRRLPIDRLVLVGRMSAFVAEPILRRWSPRRLTVLGELNPLNAAAVAASLQPGDAVLLKGSRALGLERLVDAVEQRYRRSAGDRQPQRVRCANP